MASDSVACSKSNNGDIPELATTVFLGSSAMLTDTVSLPSESQTSILADSHEDILLRKAHELVRSQIS